MTDPAMQAQLAARQLAARQQEVAAITDAALTLADTTYTVEFTIDPPVDFELRGRMVRISGVRASVTRSARPVSDDGGPYVLVKGFIQPLNSKGEPNGATRACWSYVTDDVAPFLFGKAATS